MGNLLVYKASAGSGKTFTLAVEYICLLVVNPHEYQQILAVTFTNKATAEMKNRILSHLYGIATANSESDAYLQCVTQRTGLSVDVVRTQAKQALEYIIHDYGHFMVETIDSFFQSVMRNLARELDLAPYLNIELNNSEVISQAVDRMVENLTEGSSVLSNLFNFIEDRLAEDKSWNVLKEIKHFGENLFNEVYKEQEEGGLREHLACPEYMGNYRNELRNAKSDIQNKLQTMAEDFFKELDNHALSPTDLKGGSNNAFKSYFEKLKAGDIDTVKISDTLYKAMRDASLWTKKTSPFNAIIESLAQNKFIPLIMETERVRAMYVSYSLSLRNLDKIMLLHYIDEQVRLLNHDNNTFLLSDTNALIHQLVKDNDAPFVFEKQGINLRHVMIDEFQDTSRMQWDNLRPLVLEGLSKGADSMIVGDVKQSIYRWRNGDWSILNNMDHHLGTFPIKTMTLNTNRRSAYNIVRFNNAVFARAVQCLNGIYQEENRMDCDVLRQAYADITQQPYSETMQGYVKVTLLSDSTGLNDYSEQTLLGISQQIEQLRDSGVAFRDIAILVRKNKNIPYIADFLDKKGYPIVSDEAFELKASEAVCVLVDALRVMTDTADRLSSIRLAITYHKLILKNKGNWSSDRLNELHNDPMSFLPPTFVANLRDIRMMPLYELLEKLYSMFSLDTLDNHEAYLFAFFDAVLEYLQTHTSDVETFIRYWDETLNTKPIPGGEVDGIRVLSIHKSKGLEFHTVLLPFCDWKMETEVSNTLVWCVPGQAPFDKLELLPINYGKEMGCSIYKNDYWEERVQNWVDNLNLLYVAFTRARSNLIIWGKYVEKPSTTISTVSALLRNVLDNIAPTLPLSLADNVYETGKVCESMEGKADVSTNKLLRVPKKTHIGMVSMWRNVTFCQSNDSAAFIRGNDGQEHNAYYIDRGKLLHALFASIRTMDDIDSAIENLVLDGIIRTDESQLKEWVRLAFSNPKIQDWFSGKWKLFNECSIIFKSGNGFQTKRPDRVMIDEDRVVVVDFKFGKQRHEYADQVRGYIRLLSEMGYDNITGYLWYVDCNEVEQV